MLTRIRFWYFYLFCSKGCSVHSMVNVDMYQNFFRRQIISIEKRKLATFQGCIPSVSIAYHGSLLAQTNVSDLGRLQFKKATSNFQLCRKSLQIKLSVGDKID